MTKDDLLKKKICLIFLGCDKNRVDSEKILFKLNEFGFDITTEPNEAQIIIINTCAFIESARKESIDKILEIAELKKSNLEKLVVVGCLPAKNMQEVKQSMPEIDCLLKTNIEDEIVPSICDLYGIKFINEIKKSADCERIISTPSHSVYLKIADGCNNKCSYCTIPQIRGHYISRPIQDLIVEAKDLVKNGAKEIILVAQDVTRYGEDIYKKHMLVNLIQELSSINGLEWIRLHYCYPEFVSDELIKEIANNPKVCKYMDIPMQHVNDTILHNMNRASNYDRITSLITKLRKNCPDISINTSIIVGFPGETNQMIKQMEDFLTTYRLDNVSFFEYSREQNTPAYSMKNQVPAMTKKIRLKKLVKLQSSIMYSKQLQKIDKTFRAICDSYVDGLYVFRSQYNSPDIDTLIYVDENDTKNKDITIGEFYDIHIIDIIEPFDLRGEIK